MQSNDSVKSIRQQINLFLDNELTKEQEQSLLRGMENDPKTTKLLEKEKVFRDFVKTNVRRPVVTLDFIQNLKERIRL
ncbi:MAG: hypothetical protein WBO36_04465 [Saprospiraceae bacterium]